MTPVIRSGRRPRRPGDIPSADHHPGNGSVKGALAGYNAALSKLLGGTIDNDCVYTIAGFVAYVVSCSPAGMRIQSGPMKSAVEPATAMMDARGLFPPSPPELGGKSLTELLRAGAVQVIVDREFP